MKPLNIRKITNMIIFSCIIILLSIAILLFIRKISANKYEELLADRNEFQADTIIVNDNSNDIFSVVPDSTIPSTTIQFKKNLNSKYLDINTDYVAWLKVEGTSIDYPVVRGLDNSIYLKTNFYKDYSDSGAIFMDYRNLGQFQDVHTAIYGHYMKDGSMFHDLHLYKDQSFFEAHKKINLSGLYEEKEYEIFSVYIESANNYELDFDYEAMTYMQYLDFIKKRSLYKSDLVITGNEKLLTLITCSYEIDNGRIIVHAIEVN